MCSWQFWTLFACILHLFYCFTATPKPAKSTGQGVVRWRIWLQNFYSSVHKEWVIHLYLYQWFTLIWQSYIKICNNNNNTPKEPDQITENNSITAYWDVLVFAENTEVRANRIDARIVDKVRKEILLLEMSCPWITNRRTKEEEKTRKYAPLRWELKQQYPGYEIKQVNIIIDVLGGYSEV